MPFKNIFLQSLICRKRENEIFSNSIRLKKKKKNKYLIEPRLSFRQRYSDKHYTKAIATHMAYSTNTGLHFCRDYKSRYRSDKVNGPIFFFIARTSSFFRFLPPLVFIVTNKWRNFSCRKDMQISPTLNYICDVYFNIYVRIYHIYIYFSKTLVERSKVS